MIRPDEIAQIVVGILSVQSVYALVLFPLIWGMVKCCKGKYPGWQHGFWLLILLRLVLPPDIASPWSVSHLIRSAAPIMTSQSFLSFSSKPPVFEANQKSSIATPSKGDIPDTQALPELIPAIDNSPALVPFPTLRRGGYLIIFCSWLAVVGFLLLQFLRNRRRFWKIAGKGRTIKDPVVLNVVETWRRQLHIRRRVQVKAVASGTPCFTIGLFRPVVVLPEYLISTVDIAALEPVVAHELVHVKYLDDLMICLQELVRLVYFFHPLVWFVMPRLTWTREAMCDAVVLSKGTLSPEIYGKQMLVSLRTQAALKEPCRGVAEFTPAVREMAFRLKQIKKKEVNMKTHTIKIYLTTLLLGSFLLPMAPVVSSNQINNAETQSEPEIQIQSQDSGQMADKVLSQYILRCVPCQNPEEVSRIIWGGLITEDFQEEDFSRLVSLTDCDMVENIGNGQSAYVFYLLVGSKQGLYRPNYHFVKKQNKLVLLFKSRNISTYVTDRPKINGLYEITEGWRAGLLNGVKDEGVKQAWVSRGWFWTGTQYLSAYTDYTVTDATDSSLLGTRREWDQDTQSLYESASRM